MKIRLTKISIFFVAFILTSCKDVRIATESDMCNHKNKFSSEFYGIKSKGDYICHAKFYSMAQNFTEKTPFAIENNLKNINANEKFTPPELNYHFREANKYFYTATGAFRGRLIFIPHEGITNNSIVEGIISRIRINKTDDVSIMRNAQSHKLLIGYNIYSRKGESHSHKIYTGFVIALYFENFDTLNNAVGRIESYNAFESVH